MRGCHCSADLGGAGLEHGVGEVEADHAVDRGAEVEFEGLTACGALDRTGCVDDR